MEFKLTNDLLLVRRIVVTENKTDWGFELPATEDHEDTPLRGIVIAVGPGRRPKTSGAGKDVVTALEKLIERFHAMPNIDWGSRGIAIQHWQDAENAIKRHQGGIDRIPMMIEVYDEIIFSRHGFQSFRIDGEDLIVLQEASALGVIKH